MKRWESDFAWKRLEIMRGSYASALAGADPQEMNSILLREKLDSILDAQFAIQEMYKD